MNITNLIIFISVGLIFTAAILIIIRQAVVIHNVRMERLSSEIIREAITQELVKALDEIERLKLGESDGFVKFLSDSRDWAFDYIENVQSVLDKFDKDITKIINWNETYGATTGSNPHSEKIKEISVAYKQLKDLLPQNTETPNN
jgi:signal transduction histidine kinase